MFIKGETLILDNFRSCLSNYSVDIQDVVRSAILDGVDISRYIDICKDNPFRLDQIRLCLKEGFDEASSLYKLDGDTLYRVRKLRNKGNINLLIKHLYNGNLSETHIKHLLDWIQKGRSIEGIEVSVIPKNLLSVYDTGLSYGVDMSIFNNVYCSPEYLEVLVGIAKNKRSVEKFLNHKDWSISKLKLVMNCSSNYTGWYDNWVNDINENMSYEVIDAYRVLYSCMYKLKQAYWVSPEDLGDVDNDYIDILVKAAKSGMNLRKFIGLSKSAAESKFMEMKQSKDFKISGNIRGKHE